jgi:hypothetical protein
MQESLELTSAVRFALEQNARARGSRREHSSSEVHGAFIAAPHLPIIIALRTLDSPVKVR